MAFDLFTRSIVRPENVFGWKTADINQDPPDPLTGTWIDDAVSTKWPTTPPAFVRYPLLTWYEMRYGSILNTNPLNGIPYYGGVAGYHYIAGQQNTSINMSFIIDTTPRLAIIHSPTNYNDARLIPIIDPSTPFSIYWCFIMDDYSSSSWNLLGTYPAGTPWVDDPGTLVPFNPPKHRFYLLKE